VVVLLLLLFVVVVVSCVDVEKRNEMKEGRKEYDVKRKKGDVDIEYLTIFRTFFFSSFCFVVVVSIGGTVSLATRSFRSR